MVTSTNIVFVGTKEQKIVLKSSEYNNYGLEVDSSETLQFLKFKKQAKQRWYQDLEIPSEQQVQAELQGALSTVLQNNVTVSHDHFVLKAEQKVRNQASGHCSFVQSFRTNFLLYFWSFILTINNAETEPSKTELKSVRYTLSQNSL